MPEPRPQIPEEAVEAAAALFCGEGGPSEATLEETRQELQAAYPAIRSEVEREVREKLEGRLIALRNLCEENDRPDTLHGVNGKYDLAAGMKPDERRYVMRLRGALRHMHAIVDLALDSISNQGTQGGEE